MSRWSRLSAFFVVIFAAGCLATRTPQQSVPSEPEAAIEEQPAAAAVDVQPEEPPKPSLPAPEENASAAVNPGTEPVPPGVSTYEAVRQMLRLLPGELKALTVNGRVPILLHDLNQDGNPECFAVAVQGKQLGPEEIERMSSSSRLFDEQSQPVAFYLLVLINNQGNFRRPQVLPLGERLAFESMSKVPLYKNRFVPLIVTVTFLSREGREQELLVFDNASGFPRYRTTLMESLSIQSRLEDIDADGALDIYTKERALEEGLGYESFLTWYRWNGRSFIEQQSRNVLRNLNAFLASVQEHLVARDARKLLELAVEPKEAQRLRSRGLSGEAILMRYLGLDLSGFDQLPEVSEVVFPEILENPFISQDQVGSYFQLTYRITDPNGVSYIPSARLYMLRNPFTEKQFAFYPVPANH